MGVYSCKPDLQSCKVCALLLHELASRVLDGAVQLLLLLQTACNSSLHGLEPHLCPLPQLLHHLGIATLPGD